METVTLQEIIENHIILDRPNTNGWHPVLCKVCNDSGKKGKRAGFKFENHIVAYNCFNCGHAAVYNPAENKNPSKNMKIVLDAFSISETEWKKVTLDALIHNYENIVSEYKPLEPSEIPLLPFFYPLIDDPEDDWCQEAIYYLTNRGIDWKTYPFYCVKKMDHPTNKRWYGRLIIPVYKDNKLIFYQGRDLTGIHIKKYLSATVPRDTVLYGYDQILVYNTDPLYIVEGWFDAFSINGIAIFGNKLTAQQIIWLNKTRRPKVIIPDRIGDGYILAEQAIELGWKISTLDTNDDCKDINDSILKHGMLYTIKTIVDNTTEGTCAKIITNAYCKGKRKNGRR